MQTYLNSVKEYIETCCNLKRLILMISREVETHCYLDRLIFVLVQGFDQWNCLSRFLKRLDTTLVCEVNQHKSLNPFFSALLFSLTIYIMYMQNLFKMSTSFFHPFLEPPCTNSYCLQESSFFPHYIDLSYQRIDLPSLTDSALFELFSGMVI